MEKSDLIEELINISKEKKCYDRIFQETIIYDKYVIVKIKDFRNCKEEDGTSKDSVHYLLASIKPFDDEHPYNFYANLFPGQLQCQDPPENFAKIMEYMSDKEEKRKAILDLINKDESDCYEDICQSEDHIVDSEILGFCNAFQKEPEPPTKDFDYLGPHKVLRTFKIDKYDPFDEVPKNPKPSFQENFKTLITGMKFPTNGCVCTCKMALYLARRSLPIIHVNHEISDKELLSDLNGAHNCTQDKDECNSSETTDTESSSEEKAIATDRVAGEIYSNTSDSGGVQLFQEKEIATDRVAGEIFSNTSDSGRVQLFQEKVIATYRARGEIYSHTSDSGGVQYFQDLENVTEGLETLPCLMLMNTMVYDGKAKGIEKKFRKFLISSSECHSEDELENFMESPTHTPPPDNENLKCSWIHENKEFIPQCEEKNASNSQNKEITFLSNENIGSYTPINDTKTVRPSLSTADIEFFEKINLKSPYVCKDIEVFAFTLFTELGKTHDTKYIYVSSINGEDFFVALSKIRIPYSARKYVCVGDRQHLDNLLHSIYHQMFTQICKYMAVTSEQQGVNRWTLNVSLVKNRDLMDTFKYDSPYEIEESSNLLQEKDLIGTFEFDSSDEIEESPNLSLDLVNKEDEKGRDQGKPVGWEEAREYIIPVVLNLPYFEDNASHHGAEKNISFKSKIGKCTENMHKTNDPDFSDLTELLSKEEKKKGGCSEPLTCSDLYAYYKYICSCRFEDSSTNTANDPFFAEYIELLSKALLERKLNTGCSKEIDNEIDEFCKSENGIKLLKWQIRRSRDVGGHRYCDLLHELEDAKLEGNEDRIKKAFTELSFLLGNWKFINVPSTNKDKENQLKDIWQKEYHEYITAFIDRDFDEQCEEENNTITCEKDTEVLQDAEFDDLYESPQDNVGNIETDKDTGSDEHQKEQIENSQENIEVITLQDAEFDDLYESPQDNVGNIETDKDTGSDEHQKEHIENSQENVEVITLLDADFDDLYESQDNMENVGDIVTDNDADIDDLYESQDNMENVGNTVTDSDFDNRLSFIEDDSSSSDLSVGTAEEVDIEEKHIALTEMYEKMTQSLIKEISNIPKELNLDEADEVLKSLFSKIQQNHEKHAEEEVKGNVTEIKQYKLLTNTDVTLPFRLGFMKNRNI